ncbi:hypothetical protein H4219_001691 [Mycoemilia scoparia]|uniref:Integral membrane bound transporter domain-containing protein n=1 Tax=Mycoemilia scoparia TaxID=417184 RepID=A0A9W8A5B6_9FUNG|nr:hypothetical protein H4219_001691 [Mycoemilia scoparia]
MARKRNKGKLSKARSNKHNIVTLNKAETTPTQAESGPTKGNDTFNENVKDMNQDNNAIVETQRNVKQDTPEEAKSSAKLSCATPADTPQGPGLSRNSKDCEDDDDQKEYTAIESTYQASKDQSFSFQQCHGEPSKASDVGGDSAALDQNDLKGKAAVPPPIARQKTAPVSRPVSMAFGLHSNLNGFARTRRNIQPSSPNIESDTLVGGKNAASQSGGIGKAKTYQGSGSTVEDFSISVDNFPASNATPSRYPDNNRGATESTALLTPDQDSNGGGKPPSLAGGLVRKMVSKLKSKITLSLTEPHIKVLKATTAYGIASIFAYTPFLRNLLGDASYMSPHLVVNATIWFHAAKTRSGLTEGAVIGLIWLVTSVSVSYICLGICEYLHEQFAYKGPREPSAFSNSIGISAREGGHNGTEPGYWDTLPLSKASKMVSLTMLMFIGWFVAFFKANANRPSVNTASAIFNVALYIVFCREVPLVNYKVALENSQGLSVKDPESPPDSRIGWPFPSDQLTLGQSVGQKAIHTLVALSIGLFISVNVGWWLAPRTAASQFRGQLCKSFLSLSNLLEQLGRPFLVLSDSKYNFRYTTPQDGQASPNISYADISLGAKKSEELRATLRSHRKQTLSLRKSLDAVLLEPSEWYVWGHRRELNRLVRCLDGLSIHLSSMGSGIELQHALWNRHVVKSTFSLDREASANQNDTDVTIPFDNKAIQTMLLVMYQVSKPIVELTDACKQSIKNIHDIIDESLKPSAVNKSDSDTESLPDVSTSTVLDRVTAIQRDIDEALSAFEVHYEDSVNILATRLLDEEEFSQNSSCSSNDDIDEQRCHGTKIDNIRNAALDYFNQGAVPSASLTPAEEQLFVMFFFVFGLREFTTEFHRILPYVADACKELPPAGNSVVWALRNPRSLVVQTRKGLKWVRSIAMGLLDTGATTTLESRQELEMSDPRALHNPRPHSKVQRVGYRFWRLSLWLRQLNVKFAFKYAILTTLLSLPAFWSWSSYSWYRTYRGEWSVISAAAILVPTVGGTSLTGIYRTLGTFVGGGCAFLVYQISQGNGFIAYILSVLFSIPCYNLMINSKYPRMGQFSLITYGVVLINKWIAPDDKDYSISKLTISRSLSVSIGVAAGMLFTTYIWPYEARVRLRQATSLWLLSFSVLYDRLWRLGWSSYAMDDSQATPIAAMASQDVPPLNTDVDENEPITTVREYLQMEMYLQQSLLEIDSLLSDTQNEPRLKGPLPIDTYRKVLVACQRLLDAMVSARWSMLPISTSIGTAQEILDHVSTQPLIRGNYNNYSNKDIGLSREAQDYGAPPTSRQTPYVHGRYPNTDFDSSRRLTMNSDILSSYLDMPLAFASSTVLNTGGFYQTGDNNKSRKHNIHSNYNLASTSHVQPAIPPTTPTAQPPSSSALLSVPNSAQDGPYSKLNMASLDLSMTNDILDSELIAKRVNQELLLPTAKQRDQLDGLITLSLYVLASALILKSPLPPLLPPVASAYNQLADHIKNIIIPKMASELEVMMDTHISRLTQQQQPSLSTSKTFDKNNGYSHTVGSPLLSANLSSFSQAIKSAGNNGSPNSGHSETREELVSRVLSRKRYVFYYTHVLLAGEVVRELDFLGQEMQKLFGCLNPGSNKHR